MATLETKQTAPSLLVVSPVIEPSLKHLDSKFDIGGYVECKKNLNDKEKVSILQNIWTLDSKFDSPHDNSGKYKRNFQIKWPTVAKKKFKFNIIFYIIIYFISLLIL